MEGITREGITREWLEGEIAAQEVLEKDAAANLAAIEIEYRKAKAARRQLRKDLAGHRILKHELQWHLDNME